MSTRGCTALRRDMLRLVHIPAGATPMAAFADLFRCIGSAVCTKGIKALVGLVPFGESLFEIAEETWKQFRQNHHDHALRGQIEAVAQASPEEVRQAARRTADEVADWQTSEVR